MPAARCSGDVDDERLERFLDEPLARFRPSTITTAEELRAELEHVREQRDAVSRDEEEEGLSGISRESVD